LKFSYAILVGLFLAGCMPPAEQPTPTSIGTTPIPTATFTPTVQPTTTDTPQPAEDPILVGAGDIADCSGDGDEATASLLDNVSGTVFTTGDNVYPDGTAEEFANCYEPTWGRHVERTRPSPGNHDYHTA